MFTVKVNCLKLTYSIVVWYAIGVRVLQTAVCTLCVPRANFINRP